jgi:uncharacterized protein
VNTSEQARRPPVMLTWQRLESPSLESVRLLFSGSRLRAYGRIVAAANQATGTQAFNASFAASVERAEEAGKLLFRTTTADEERQMSLNRTEDGLWLIDHGDGTQQRSAFDGAIDVDVSGAVTFNALPIRRLGLHREAGEHELPVLTVSLPDLSVMVVRQTYRTVSIDKGGAVINYSDPDFDADLTIDRDGMLIDFPGRARRL